MVYREPDIKSFVNYAESLFNKNKSTGLIYFVSYKEVNNKSLPKNILQYIKTRIFNHVDGKIIYLDRNNKINECIVLYGKDKYKTISHKFGSFVSAKIDPGSWKIYNKINNRNIKEFYLGWGLEQYNFNKFKVIKSLEAPDNLNIADITVYLVLIDFASPL